MSSSSTTPVTHFGNAVNTASDVAQNSRGTTLESFLACLVVSASVFVVEIVGFLVLRSRFRQI